MEPLWEDRAACHSAFAAHDARFDGRVFIGCTSTGVYCRPVCRVRVPRPANCRYFPSAAAAEAGGFRPCLKCRPELAPGLAPTDSPSRLARRAATIISDDPLSGRMEEVAAKLGVTSRQLRRVFIAEYGVPPVRFAQTARLLLAKGLLTDTGLPIGTVALAAGFGSVRRFNEAFSGRYRLSPRRFRKGVEAAPAARDSASEAVPLSIGYRPPLDFPGLLLFLQARAIRGVEQVEGGRYRRTVRLERGGVFHSGWVEVCECPGKAALRVNVAVSLLPVLPQVLGRIRALFDLDCDPAAIHSRLGSMDALRPGMNRLGIRVPGAFDGFELAVRAILGQQVSVKAARTLAGRIAGSLGEPVATGADGLDVAFPTAERIAALGQTAAAVLGPLGVTAVRSKAIQALADQVAAKKLTLSPSADAERAMRQLSQIPGVGPWTANYIAMRALSWPDSFPHSDFGIKLALKRGLGLGEYPEPRQILELAEAWRPWRSYAVLNLWRSLE